MPTPNDSLAALYGFLDPKIAADTSAEITAEDHLTVAMKVLVGSEGSFKDFEGIKKDLDPTKFPAAGQVTGKILHGMHASEVASSQTDYLVTADNQPDEYWKMNGAPTSMFGGIISDKNMKATDAKASATAFVTRGPFISPSRRNADKVEFFLNSIPSYFSSKMIPYLAVEFQLPKFLWDETGKKKGEIPYTSTPSTLRFLLGSDALGKLNMTPGDVALELATYLREGEGENGQTYAYSGMELFLAPQTMTNMDTLNASSSRVANVKPFLPFMSIEGVTMNSINAGSGAMVHKKASLKLKIHDKARLPEIAEFIKGPSGFSNAIIWITYGWIAPRSMEKDDAYASFINNNMLVKNAWQVANSQYSFDLSGTVSLNLELVSKGIQTLRAVNMNKPYNTAQMDQLNSIMKYLRDIQEKLTSASSRSAQEIRIAQVISAGIAGQTSVKNAEAEIKALSKALKTTGVLTSDEISELESKLKTLEADGADPEGKKINRFETALQEEVAAAILGMIENCKDGTDPFLPQEGNKQFFINYPKIKKALDLFITPPVPPVPKDKKQEKEKTPAEKPNFVEIKPSIRYVSFGKLFMNTIMPAILQTQEIANEVQVIFYGLNNECGPISGCSIAEFPIDTARLAYAYSDFIRTQKSYDMTIEKFMGIIVQSQFNKTSAIGYGASHLYEYHPEGGEEKANEKIDGYADLLAEWQYSDPPFITKPSIEMKIETGRDGGSMKTIDEIQMSVKEVKINAADVPDSTELTKGAKKVIMRIHVYDKQNSPYKNVGQILNTDNSFINVSSTAGSRFEQKLKSTIESIQDVAVKSSIITAPDKATQLDLITKYLESTNTSLETLFVDAVGSVQGKIGKNKKDIIAAVSRFVPTITYGTNGSLISQASMATKTDSLASAANLVNQSKNIADGANPAGPPNAIEGPDGIPIRTFPGQLTMTSLGCPIAELYQQYFVNFGTGTSLDNIYTCNSIIHNISQGKFETQWTFIFSDGYGSLAGAPTPAMLARNIATKQLLKMGEDFKKAEAAAAPAAGTKKKPGK